MSRSNQPPPAKSMKASLFALYWKAVPSSSASKTVTLAAVASSYLASIHQILDGNDTGMPWQLVRGNKQFVSLKALLENIFCCPCTSAPVE